MISIASEGKPHQREWAKRLKAGADAIGLRAREINAGERAQTAIVACWGWRTGKLYRDRGHEVLVAERGYVGDRFHWTSLAWNGLNGHGDHCAPHDASSERWETHHAGKMRPWRIGGSHALVMGQVPGDASLMGTDYLGWITETVQDLRAAGHDVVFRPHPGAPQVRPPCEISTGTLQADLDACAFAVAFNSNSSVDAILNGTPCIVANRGSMAWEMCGHHIGQVLRPPREKWAHRLAWTQWEPDELKDGSALVALGLAEMERNDLANS